MGLSTLFSDIWDSFSHPAADAEAPPSGGTSTNSPASGTDEESGEEAEANKQDAKGDDGDEEQAGDKDDEEEEEEVQDPKHRLEEECKASKECSPAKHHYDVCAERVTGQIESDGKAKEDCVEEFFHLLHCATTCSAPKLFRELK